MATALKTSNPNTAEDQSAVKSITIRLAGSALNEIRQKAEKRGITINEFVRRAIGTEVFLMDAKDEKQEILLRDPSGQLQKVILR